MIFQQKVLKHQFILLGRLCYLYIKDIKDKPHTETSEQTVLKPSVGEIEEFESSIGPSNVEEEKRRWQTCVHRRSSEENAIEERVEEATTRLRKSTRQRKLNPRYANTILAEEFNAHEPSTYCEASQHNEWREAMEEEV